MEDQISDKILFQKRMIRRFQIMFVVFLIIVLGLGGLSFYLWHRLSSVYVAGQTQAQPSVDEAKILVEKVGKLIVLPPNEEPTIATVSNLDSLKGQAFFAQAQIGDKVLLYNTSKKAILYNPKENKIVEVAPISSR